MTRLFSKQTNRTVILFALLCFSLYQTSYAVNSDPRKAEEIKQQMWNSGDKDFDVTDIPAKWTDKSAVIIAKSNTLSYRKAVLVANLSYDRYIHHRIKLLDNSSVEKYSQFNIPEGYGNKSIIYAGFKVIKKSGEQIEIPMEQAVKQERKLDGSGYNFYKLAIPNLEVGDIIDYYMGEEQTINLATKYYSFDAVIFQLNEEYPIMKQKISFDVLRRCFINLKTLNGAPEFSLTEDAKNDKNSYRLEDADRESVKDVRWLFPNRQLPTIKFKVTYASAFAAQAPSFIGDPGVLKSRVTKTEVEALVKYIFNSGSYYGSDLNAYMRKHFKKEKDLNQLARTAYYAQRNIMRIANEEAKLLSGSAANYSSNNIKDVIGLSNYYRWQDIPHEIIIGVPREISTIDDLILENELSFMIKVKTSEPFYIGRFTGNSIIGEIDASLQGTKAYAVDGVMNPSRWHLYETEIPEHKPEDNMTVSHGRLTISDLEDEEIMMDIDRSVKGANRIYYQYLLMDVYNYKEVERKKFEMGEDFENYKKSERKVLIKKKADYMANREKNFNETVKSILTEDLDFTVEDAHDLEVKQTGRFHEHPEFVYTCQARIDGALKKVGNNYLLDIGKFIDRQVQLTDVERKRKYDVYLPYARSYNYTIEMEIPDGYAVQGLDKLNSNIKNDVGGFVSSASIESNTLKVETLKYYNSNFEEMDNWPLMIEFLDAAYNFTQQKVLLKKI